MYNIPKGIEEFEITYRNPWKDHIFENKAMEHF